MPYISANNVCSFIGRLCQDPELMMTTSGKEIVSFSLALDKGYGESKRTIFPRMVAFGPQAKYISKLTKGTKISVVCDYDIREFTKENEKKQSHEFTVLDVDAHGKREAVETAGTGQVPLAYASNASAELPKFEEISSDGDLPF